MNLIPEIFFPILELPYSFDEGAQDSLNGSQLQFLPDTEVRTGQDPSPDRWLPENR